MAKKVYNVVPGNDADKAFSEFIAAR